MLTYAFRCIIAHSLIKDTVSSLNWQQHLVIAFVFAASVLSALRIKVNGLYTQKDQLYQELIDHVEINAKNKLMPRRILLLSIWGSTATVFVYKTTGWCHNKQHSQSDVC